jgi:endonuclease YncB( thermonuclease family)
MADLLVVRLDVDRLRGCSLLGVRRFGASVPLAVPDQSARLRARRLRRREAHGMSPTLPYVQRITDVVRVVDGDTYHLQVSLPFYLQAVITVRLDGFDCPELNGGDAYEKQKGQEAKALAVEFLTLQDAILWVRTEKDPDSFGRWLGDIWSEDVDGNQQHLGDVLRAAGLASVWPTRWHQEFEPA